MKPLGWSDFLEQILRELKLPHLCDERIVVASDYSGDDSTVWWSVSFLIVELNSLLAPDKTLRKNLSQITEPRDFKKIRSPSDELGIEPFLNEINKLNGHLLLFGSQAKMKNLSCKAGSIDKLKKRKVLQASWDKKSFERMNRVCHVLARHLHVYAPAKSTVEWYSDRDQILTVKTGDGLRKSDLVSFVNSLRQHYSGNGCGSVIAENSKEKDVRELPRLLCKVSDLTAGAYNNKLKINEKSLNFAQLGTTLDNKDQTKADIRYSTIEKWISNDSSTLKKVQLVITETAAGNISLWKFHQNTV